ncbi:MAG: hypothetical protein J6M95_03650 [Bacilli bacterium]|nr:hypothetical protein [Bacilli bacterium]
MNKGRLYEDEMIQLINGKKYKDLSPNIQQMIQYIYGVVDPEEVIGCSYAMDLIKPDFVLRIRDDFRYVSMKSGSAETVHCENLVSFIPFLRSLGVSRETLETILLFHFGDGTTDGTGKIRKGYSELIIELRDRIRKANSELNQSSEFIKAFLERVLFRGVSEEAPGADAIYYGDSFFGFTATKHQIRKYIVRKNWNKFDNLHIGPIFLRPAARYLKGETLNVNKRNSVECYWPRMQEDIKYICKNFSFYTPVRYRSY